MLNIKETATHDYSSRSKSKHFENLNKVLVNDFNVLEEYCINQDKDTLLQSEDKYVVMERLTKIAKVGLKISSIIKDNIIHSEKISYLSSFYNKLKHICDEIRNKIENKKQGKTTNIDACQSLTIDIMPHEAISLIHTLNSFLNIDELINFDKNYAFAISKKKNYAHEINKDYVSNEVRILYILLIYIIF